MLNPVAPVAPDQTLWESSDPSNPSDPAAPCGSSLGFPSLSVPSPVDLHLGAGGAGGAG